MTVGIGIVSYNRLAAMQRCVDAVRRYTRTPHTLIVADDGSEDGTAEWCRANGIRTISGPNRGVAFNNNRLYYEFAEHTDCDPFIVLEQDAVPCVEGWELSRIAASWRWGHVAFASTAPPPWKGGDTPTDPFWCVGFGAQCVTTTRSAFQQVGYFDPRFYIHSYSNAHAEWSFRFARHYDWPVAPHCKLICGLRRGVETIDLGSFATPAEIEATHATHQTIGEDEPVYRAPWRSDVERDEFLRDTHRDDPNREDRRSVTELKNRHFGADIWLIASGSSMDHVDPVFFRGKLTVGVNDVYKKFPCCYLVRKEHVGSEDAFRSGIPLILSKHDSGSYRGVLNSVPGRAWYFDHPDNIDVPLEAIGTDQLIASASTITSALHLCAYMGAANIIVCGHDGGTLDGRTTYHGYYPEPDAAREEWYRGWVQGMMPQTFLVRDRLQEVYGCRIYGLNPFLSFQLEGHRFEA